MVPRVRIPYGFDERPSIWDKNYVLMPFETWFCSPYDLFEHSESTSSINMIEGFFSLPSVNRVLMSFSDSPTYLLFKSDADTEKNVPFDWEAQALARKVFPVPGGP